ncbi:uncharacterized protein BX663DRAFT_256015 [Cokeromyces recurvatus]|uniref:uncharacterized protein n=1 Tax=Cokeromyces recurvatus TaxID=90255 RepID=UPI00222100FF|nr:uncharacterized protein BX663DRAFT_256015 [Cokeromyces recurvatus]KAI7906210.1 hypothetical protein BX663DRAFT_256015 [Cokeromyces recurvatus]
MLLSIWCHHFTFLFFFFFFFDHRFFCFFYSHLFYAVSYSFLLLLLLLYELLLVLWVGSLSFSSMSLYPINNKKPIHLQRKKEKNICIYVCI